MITLRNMVESDGPELQKKKYGSNTIAEIQEKVRIMNTKVYNARYFEMFAIINRLEMVGMISLYEHSESVVSFGIEIFEHYRRKGYAYEALLQALSIARNKGYKIVTVQIHVDNVASIALHKKAGFETDFYEYINRKGTKVYIMMRLTENSYS